MVRILRVYCCLICVTICSAQILSSTSLKSCLIPGSIATAPTNILLNFTQVYAQFDQGQSEVEGELGNGFDWKNRPIVHDNLGQPLMGTTGRVLRIVLIGTVDSTSPGSSALNLLETVIINSEILSFQVAANASALCTSIVTGGISGSRGCPYGPGAIALGISIPLASSYPLTTISTSFLLLDASEPALTLTCFTFDTSPYYPQYFAYTLIHYVPIALLSTFLFLYVTARAYAAHSAVANESEVTSSLSLQGSAPRYLWRNIWYGAWSGTQIVRSGSLRRFVTPAFTELFKTMAYLSLVGTVAVDWPGYAYPIFAQTAWTTLIYNSTLPFVTRSAPLLSNQFNPPSIFAASMADSSSPIYLNSTLPSVLLDLESSSVGIERWSSAIGVDSSSLFSICAALFFSICAIIISLHLVISLADASLNFVFPPPPRSSRIPVGYGGKERAVRAHSDEFGGEEEEEEEEEGLGGLEDQSRMWTLHLALLIGNLVRILVLFHLPLTLFSVYQLSLHATSPTSTLILAGVTLGGLSILPIILATRIYLTPSSILLNRQLYLLSFGPLYNTYNEHCMSFGGVGFVTSFVAGVVLGALQSKGTVQAALLLVIEVMDAFSTTLFLPFGDDAAMGPIGFSFAIVRITIAVLLIVLSPAVAVSTSAASWITYVVFLMQGLLLILLFFVLVFKLVELGVRLFGRVAFDGNSRYGGMMGAFRRLDRGSRKSGQSAGNNRVRLQSTTASQFPVIVSRQRSSSSVNMLDDKSYRSSPQRSRSPGPSTSYGDDDGYIMSSWNNAGNGYRTTTPSSYPTSTPSSSFTRVGGGRATSSNPYQLDQRQQPPPSAAYPPYSPSTPGLAANPYRRSSSAVIELAPTSTRLVPVRSHSTPLSPLPATSGLLTNSVPRSLDPPIQSKPVESRGFFNRFRRRRTSDASSDDDDDDEDDDEEGAVERSKWNRFWPIRSKKGIIEEEQEAEVDPAAREFVVVRKPQPASRVTRKPSSSIAPLPTPIPLTPLVVAISPAPTPHLSIEPASPRGSVVMTGDVADWDHDVHDGEYEVMLLAARGRRASTPL